MKNILFLIALSPFLLFSWSSLAQEKKSEPIKPALIIIDVQNAFLPIVEEREKTVATYMINAYIDMFRKHGLPIILVYHMSDEYGVVPGTPGFEFGDAFVLPAEVTKVTKTYPNAFTKTDLDKILKEKEINTLFLCGLSSVGCVLATWFGAKDYDYKAFLLKSSLMSHDAQYTKQIETIFGALDDEAVGVMIGK
jgi:nicotinamidase-related amidase